MRRSSSSVGQLGLLALQVGVGRGEFAFLVGGAAQVGVQPLLALGLPGLAALQVQPQLADVVLEHAGLGLGLVPDAAGAVHLDGGRGGGLLPDLHGLRVGLLARLGGLPVHGGQVTLGGHDGGGMLALPRLGPLRQLGDLLVEVLVRALLKIVEPAGASDVQTHEQADARRDHRCDRDQQADHLVRSQRA